MFKKKTSRPLAQLFSEAFQYLITNTDLFPDPEEVTVDCDIPIRSLDHLVFDELVLAFIVLRLEIGAKAQYKDNLSHVHESFLSGLIDALDNFQELLPTQSFLEAVGSYEKSLDFEAEITSQMVSCYKVFSSRLLEQPKSGYSPLITLVNFVRIQVIQPLLKSAELQFKFD